MVLQDRSADGARFFGPYTGLNKDHMAAPPLPDDVTVTCPAMDRVYTKHVLNGLPLPSGGGKDSDALQSELHCPHCDGGQRNMRLVVRSEQSRFKRGQT